MYFLYVHSNILEKTVLNTALRELVKNALDELGELTYRFKVL